VGLLITVLLVLVIWLWTKVSRLSERTDYVERKLLEALDTIRDLQQQRRATPDTAAPPATQTVTAPPQVQHDSGNRFPESIPGVVWTPESPVLAESATSDATPRKESWEIAVGTGWLNKIGVLVLVIAVALIVRYSFTEIGPAGRVVIGYVLCGAMLGVGVWLERRETFRNYAYGLVAGGWAGIYFTTFAMHDVPEAKVLDSDLAAVSLLSAVAAGMIGHSLRYRSQVVTALAFIVAYATLALSPLSGFSLAASVPLAMVVLVVSQRLGWPGISVLGIAATYGIFVLRSEVFPGGTMDPVSRLPYITLAAYWLTFEIADLIGIRLRRAANPAGPKVQVSMLALNAAGFLGAIVIISPGTHPEWRSTLLFATGAAYVASAVLRAWLLPERRRHEEKDQPFDVAHAATAMAALLFEIAIGLRFSETQAGLAWLLETQLLFVAGLTLPDRWLRRLASIVAALVTMHAGLLTLLSRGGATAALGMSTDAIVAVMVAMIWYANREAIRIRGAEASWLEPAYTWAGAALLVTCGWVSLSPAHLGLAGWILSLLLLEAGLRRDNEYTLQSYAIGGLAGYVTLLAFLMPGSDGILVGWGPAPGAIDDWTALPIGIAACTIAAIRLRSFRGPRPVPALAAAAGAAIALAVALTVMFEWRVLPVDAIAPAWALTAVGLVAVGFSKKQAALRWLGYVVSFGAIVRQLGPLMEVSPGLMSATAPEVLGTAVVAACVYACAWLARRGAADHLDNPAVGPGLFTVSTALVALLLSRVCGDMTSGPACTTAGIVLLALGHWKGLDDHRWNGYAMLALGALRAGRPVFGEAAAASGATAWLVACLAAVYVMSLASRRLTRAALPDSSHEAEDFVITVLLVGATGMLAGVIIRQGEPSMVTLILALQGLGVMATGLLARERVLRLSGLALLLGCLLKLFLYDLRELEPLPRIFSFVVLGLVLLGISWAYTRFREQIMKLL
jgi:uncharacterized membrane protein